MLDLHVWGSAFGLPSIDPECLAIITYLHNASLSSGEWRLIPNNDPSISPSNTLPALHHNNAWVSGYGPIVDYLTSKSLVTDLDANLTPVQKADRVAYSAYLAAHAAPLLDLSLYVSAANWAATTRPAYSALLPFPLTWTVPPLIRAEAVKRVEHLGFADMDSDFDPNGGLHLSTGRDALPEAFRRHLPTTTRKTVQEEMTPEQAVAIRLYGLVEDCLSVVNDALKDGGEESLVLFFFEGSRPSSLDCLAYGYLALMRDADVPRSFLKDWLVQKTPRLSKFVDSIKTTLTSQGDLPWVEAERRTAFGVGARTLDTVCYHLPGVGDEYANEKRRRAEQGITGIDKRAVILAMSTIATAATLGYGLYMYKAMQPFGSRTQIWSAERSRSRLSDFGELGSMLGSVMGGYQAPAPSGLAGGRIVETDSELD